MLIRTIKALAACLAVSAAAAPAHAVAFFGTYNVTAHIVGDGLLIGTQYEQPLHPVLGDPVLDFSLDVGQSTSVDLFEVFTNETDVGLDDLEGKAIQVNFNFTAPENFGGSMGGTTTGHSFWGVIEWGYLNWSSNSAVLNYGNGGELLVRLNDTKFNKGLFGLKEGERYGGDVIANFTLQQASTPGPVPEPATWAMMIVGFGAIGAALRSARRRPLPLVG